MFFCNCSHTCNVLITNWLHDNKSRETAKTRPHDVIFIGADPRFSAKQGYFRVIFECQTINYFASYYPAVTCKL
jgi:hypothetical protein